jgi:HEAT repeat protein
MSEGNVQAFVDGLNAVKRNDPDPQILAYLHSTWQESKSQAPPAFLKQELVLLELAATLAQASLNDAMYGDEAEFHELIRRAADSQILDIRERALFSLSMFDDPADVAVLEQALESADDSIYRTAVVALASMCTPQAEESLREAESALPPDRRAFLEEVRTKYRGELDRSCESRMRQRQA